MGIGDPRQDRGTMHRFVGQNIRCSKDSETVASVRRDAREVAERIAGPAEVGQLYRLFLKAGFPLTISKADRYLVATDAAEQIIGGVVYHKLDPTAVFLDGIVVTQALAERGIAAAILQDFCTRLKTAGYETIKTHFFLRRFYQKHGFRIDQRWGGLVRHI